MCNSSCTMSTNVGAKQSWFGDFFKANFWHLIILFGWILTGTWFVSRWSHTIDLLDKRLAAAEIHYESLVKDMETIRGTGSLSFQQHLVDATAKYNSLDTRLVRLENSMTVLPVMANDITWIKAYLIKDGDKSKPVATTP